MVLTLKHKIRYYRRFRTDIWGLKLLGYMNSNLVKYKRVTKIFLKWYRERLEKKEEIMQRFIYRIDIVHPGRKYLFVNKRFLTLRLVKLFYLTLKYRQFNKIASVSIKKDGNFENHFFLALEGRVISFLYRTGFASNMFESLFYVKNFFVVLNKKIVSYYNEQVNLYDILSFHPCVKKYVYFNFFKRIVFDKRSLFNPPRYMYVSYWFLFAYMYKYLIEADLTKTTRYLDYYRATGFAF